MIKEHDTVSCVLRYEAEPEEMQQLAAVACAVEQFPSELARMSLACSGSMTFGGGTAVTSQNLPYDQHTDTGDVAGQSFFIFWMHIGDARAFAH